MEERSHLRAVRYPTVTRSGYPSVETDGGRDGPTGAPPRPWWRGGASPLHADRFSAPDLDRAEGQHLLRRFIFDPPTHLEKRKVGHFRYTGTSAQFSYHGSAIRGGRWAGAGVVLHGDGGGSRR